MDGYVIIPELQFDQMCVKRTLPNAETSAEKIGAVTEPFGNLKIKKRPSYNG